MLEMEGNLDPGDASTHSPKWVTPVREADTDYTDFPQHGVLKDYEMGVSCHEELFQQWGIWLFTFSIPTPFKAQSLINLCCSENEKFSPYFYESVYFVRESLFKCNK